MRSILQGSSRRADIKIAGTKITLNKRVVVSLDLKAGDVIDFGVDMLGEWYVYRRLKAEDVQGRYDCQLHAYSGSCVLVGYSKRMTDAVRELLGTEERRLSLCCGKKVEVDGYDALVVIMRRIIK